MSVCYIPAGNITDDSADILVNTVNEVGVAGKGVALAFRNRWPAIMRPYKAACASGRLRAGGCLLFPLPGPEDAILPLFGAPRQRFWAALATKSNWRDPSRIGWIETGLAELARLARDAGARSVAIPPPGCGNGGLDWKTVEPLVLDALRGFDLRIYAAGNGG